MALGPEYNIAVIKTKEEKKRRYRELQRLEALTYINAIVRAAEKVLDKSIINGDNPPHASEYSIARQYDNFPWRKRRVRFIFVNTNCELQDLLGKKYLPLGWGKIEVKLASTHSDGYSFDVIELYK